MNKFFYVDKLQTKTLFTDSSLLIFKSDKSYFQSMLFSVICYSGNKPYLTILYEVIFRWNVGVNDSQRFLFSPLSGN